MIYLVRHGQTEFNREGRYQGACDSPLTELGARQARAVGLLLRDVATAETAIVASPLGRTRRTAEIVREAGGFAAAVRYDARLAEISMGVWDGLLITEIEALRPPFPIDQRPPDWFMRSPDGETYEDMEARIGSWLAEAAAQPRPLIAISHGVAGRIVRQLYLGLGRDEAMRLPSPQDAVWRLDEGRIERLDVEPVA